MQPRALFAHNFIRPCKLPYIFIARCGTRLITSYLPLYPISESSTIYIAYIHTGNDITCYTAYIASSRCVWYGWSAREAHCSRTRISVWKWIYQCAKTRKQMAFHIVRICIWNFGKRQSHNLALLFASIYILLQLKLLFTNTFQCASSKQCRIFENISHAKDDYIVRIILWFKKKNCFVI